DQVHVTNALHDLDKNLNKEVDFSFRVSLGLSEALMLREKGCTCLEFKNLGASVAFVRDQDKKRRNIVIERRQYIPEFFVGGTSSSKGRELFVDSSTKAEKTWVAFMLRMSLQRALGTFISVFGESKLTHLDDGIVGYIQGIKVIVNGVKSVQRFNIIRDSSVDIVLGMLWIATFVISDEPAVDKSFVYEDRAMKDEDSDDRKDNYVVNVGCIRCESMKNGENSVGNVMKMNRVISIMNVKDADRRRPKREHIPDTQAMNDKHPKNLDSKIDRIDETAESAVDFRCMGYDELSLKDKMKIKGLPDTLFDENVLKRSCGVYSNEKALMSIEEVYPGFLPFKDSIDRLTRILRIKQGDEECVDEYTRHYDAWLIIINGDVSKDKKRHWYVLWLKYHDKVKSFIPEIYEQAKGLALLMEAKIEVEKDVTTVGSKGEMDNK
ncbi:10124_t:CDS:2, partial [Racocetra persica]